MRCEQANDRIIDNLTGEIGDIERSELNRHLAQCAECRDQQRDMEAVWIAMADVDVAPGVPAGPLGVKGSPRRLKTVGVIAAALMVGLFTGYTAGRSRAPVSTEGARFDGGYLALLRQASVSLGADAPPETTLVREYGEWARELAANDQLIAAEQLNDLDVMFIAPNGAIDVQGRTLAPHISGYFLIRADNLDDARRTVLTMPHLRHGGWIELRETVK